MGIAATTTQVSRYIRDIHKFPMLSAEEELRLARRYRDHRDEDAADKLVVSHLRLVVKVALGFRGYGLPLDDLISEGNCGMMQAVRRFDPERGFRLATYAIWWIRAAIAEHVLHNSSLVKMGTTATQKKLFFNLRKLKGRVKAPHEGDLDSAQVTRIATLLKVPEREVISMNSRLRGPDHSLNIPMDADGRVQWLDQLVDESETQEDILAEREQRGRQRALLADAWAVLNNRERRIVTERWLVDSPTTLESLSQHYGISRERVRQIEARAFQKLQRAIKAHISQTDRAQAVLLSPSNRAGIPFVIGTGDSERAVNVTPDVALV